MSQERNLAFLQNFYTDVTLYVPAETGTVAQPAPASISAAAAQSSAPPVSVPPPASSTAPEPRVAAPTPVVAPPATVAPLPSVTSVAPKLPSLSSIPTAPVTPPAPAVALVSAVTLPTAPAPAVEVPASPVPVVPPVMLTTFSTLGDRPNGLVLLFRLPPEQFKKLPRNVFLNKMLQALGLVMADVVLVNVESHLPVALANLRREISAGRILAFGKNLLDVAVRNTQIYEPVQFPSLDLSYLAAAEVELIEYDTSLKKRLWSGLQRMFA